MGLIIRFVFAALLATAGCLMISTGDHACFSFGAFVIVAHSWFVKPRGYYGQEVHFTLPRWNAGGFFRGMMISLGMLFVLLLLFQFPGDQKLALFRKWHITATLWLLVLSNIARCYVMARQHSGVHVDSHATESSRLDTGDQT